MAVLRVVVVVLSAIFFATVNATAKYCRGRLSTNTFSNVFVSSGQSCILSAYVNGSVFVDTGATLKTVGNVTVTGKVLAYYSDTIDLQGTTRLEVGLEVKGALKVIIGTLVDAGSVYIRRTNLFLHAGTADHLRINGYGVTNVRIWGGKVLSRPNRFLQTGYFYAVDLRTFGMHDALIQVPTTLVNTFGHLTVHTTSFNAPTNFLKTKYGPISIFHNNFNWNKLGVLNNAAPIVISGNKRFKTKVSGNRNSLFFQRNGVHQAKFFDNKNGTAIVDNWFGRGGISCRGIFPWPWMRRNRFTAGAPKLGQCRKA